MKRLTPPTFNAEQVLDCCIAGIASIDTVSKLIEARDLIIAREAEYLLHGNARSWFAYDAVDKVINLTNLEMKNLYSYELSLEKGCAYHFYSKIKNSAPHNKCPFCGTGVVSSVDHYLPKAKYSDITITPLNLIPACNDCNKFKHTRFPKDYTAQIIHPYFDDFTKHQWVRGVVTDEGSPVVLFDVDSLGQYNADDENRLKNHFRALRLPRLFASNAAEQLTTDKRNFVDCFKADGNDGVKDHLLEQADRYAQRSLNSWQTVFYKALSESEWFISEGYDAIPD